MKKKEYVKIWNELLNDVKFQNLTLSQQAQFLNLLIFINIYGEGGALIVHPPAQLLSNTLRCPDYNKLSHTLKKISEIFKGFSCNCNDGYMVIAFKNWHKYQIDNSVERVRRHRYLAVTKVTDPRIKDFIDYAYSSCKEKRNFNLHIDGGKDGDIVKRLLSTHDIETLKKLWDKMLLSEEEFIRKAGISIGVFKSQINKLISGGGEKSEYEARWDRIGKSLQEDKE